MSEVMYKQCYMEKQVSDTGKICRTSWIPERFAVVGLVVKLKDNNNWTDGWEIISASEKAETEKTVMGYSRAHLKQRKASDI